MLPGGRGSAADRHAALYKNAHALVYVDDAAPRRITAVFRPRSAAMPIDAGPRAHAVGMSHHADETGMSWSFEPRSGAIYVAQCVSIGKMDRMFKSRGAAASRRKRPRTCDKGARSSIAMLPGCRRSAADRHAVRCPNAH